MAGPVRLEVTGAMRKIPTIYTRDWDGDPKYVTREPNAECAWVFAGEGKPTRKYDGTCVRFDGERWWARREVRPGRPEPAGFELVGEDARTGRRVGWEPAEGTGFHRYLVEAAVSAATGGDGAGRRPGTYELCGPKINGNPERYAGHRLVRHADAEPIEVESLTWEGIRAAVLAAEAYGVEGIVWHHDDGRMAKIKARDFRR